MKIILIGFMGSGKSTVGRILAKKLGFNLLEMDTLLLERTGYLTIADIFSQRGEAFFRDQETALAQTLAQQSKVVISTGGGTPCREENMQALKMNEALTVYLSLPFELVQKRVGHDSTRPLWKNVADAKTLFEQRGPIYLKAADSIVDASKDPELLAEEISQAFERRT